jgi:hypothetical protein
MSNYSDQADSSDGAGKRPEDEHQFKSPQKAEQIRTTIGKVVKDDQTAARRFKYLVDKTLAAEEDAELRRDETA